MFKSLRVAQSVLPRALVLAALVLLPGAASAVIPRGDNPSGQGDLQGGTLDLGGVTVYYDIQNFAGIPDGYLDWTVQVRGDCIPVGVAVQEERFNTQTNSYEWVTVAQAGDLQDTTAEVSFPENDRPVRLIFMGTQPGHYTWHTLQ